MNKNIGFSVLMLTSLVGANFFVPKISSAVTATGVNSPFAYNFAVDGSLVETNLGEKSTSGYWWLSSGGRMILGEGKGQTLQGSLPATDTWRVLYSLSNPADTDQGYHPQNVFRLVGRSLWSNFRQEVYFEIKKDNLSSSSNRNASNGLLLFNRYKDQNNLYYTGIRVDGYAVIKKKVNGTYYTMAYVKVLPGTYNKSSNPNLLPKNTPIGLRSEVVTNAGKVSVKLYTDIGQTGTWKLAAQVVDDGSKYGKIIDGAGFGGMRTDFMDVTFDQYKMNAI